MQPKAPTIVPTADVGLLDLPESVLVVVRAAGITSDSDFAWSCDEEELRKELDQFRMWASMEDRGPPLEPDEMPSPRGPDREEARKVKEHLERLLVLN